MKIVSQKEIPKVLRKIELTLGIFILNFFQVLFVMLLYRSKLNMRKKPAQEWRNR